MAETSFEKSIGELDEIVKKLEGGDLPLDDMLALFEKGISLSRVCNDMLTKAEAKVNLLVNKGDSVEKQEFQENLTN